MNRNPASKTQEAGVMGGIGALAAWGATMAHAQWGIPIEATVPILMGGAAVLASFVRDRLAR